KPRRDRRKAQRGVCGAGGGEHQGGDISSAGAREAAAMTARTQWLTVGGLAILWLALVDLLLIDVPPPQEVPLKYTSGHPVAGVKPEVWAESWEVPSLRASLRELAAAPKRNIFMAGSTSSGGTGPKVASATTRAPARTIPAAPQATAASPPSPEELAQ